MIFKIFIVFLLVFIWCRFYVHDLAEALLYASAVTILFGIGFVIKEMKKQKQIVLSKSSKTTKQQFDDFLIFNTQKENIEFFNEYINGKECSEGVIEITPNNYFVPHFTVATVTKDELVKIIKSLTNLEKMEKVTICGVSFDRSCQMFAEQVVGKEIKLLTGGQFFQQYNLDAQKIKPKVHIRNSKSIGWKMFIQMLVDGKNAKGYFASSLFLCFASFIIPYNIYYIVFASILLIMSMVCFGQKNKKNT